MYFPTSGTPTKSFSRELHCSEHFFLVHYCICIQMKGSAERKVLAELIQQDWC
jgi:hypothetical protein